MIVSKQLSTHKHRSFGRPLPFVLIIAYKAGWGFLEVVAGTLILLSWRIITRELVEDPNDLFLNWLLLHFPFGPSQALPLGAAIATFGVAKIALAVGLWFHPHLTRQIAIVFLIGVAIFGIYTSVHAFSLFKIVALGVELLILAYFIFVLPRHLNDAALQQ